MSLAGGYWAVTDAGSGRTLTPRTYSTGLTQDQAVRSIVEAFRRAARTGGEQDVFFVAGTGSGKSLVALNVIARTGGRGIVAIPTVNLQDQYEEAALSMRVLRPDGRALRVVSVKGRKRYACRHEGGTAAERHVCSRGGGKSRDAAWRRAATCPFWAPTLTRDAYEALYRNAHDLVQSEPLSDEQKSFLAALDGPDVKGWDGVDGESSFVHVGPRGCDYMDAHHAFASGDVVVLSNRKWQVETDLGRKPRVDVEVFDEADGFLDELFEEQRLTVEGMRALLAKVGHAARCLSLTEDKLRNVEGLDEMDPDPRNLPDPEGFFALQSLVRRITTFRSPDDFDDEKTWRGLEAVPAMVRDWPKMAVRRLRDEFPGRAWASLHVENILVTGGVQDENENILAKVKGFVENRESLILAYDATGVYFTFQNLRAPLKRMTSRCAPLRLWMSATFPSAQILRQVYGFDDPLVIQGEPRYQGVLKVAEGFVAAPKVTARTWGESGPYARAPLKAERETRARFVATIEDVFRRIPAGERTVVIVHGKSRILDVAESSPVARWIAGELEDDAERHEERLREFMAGKRTWLASTRIARGVDFSGDLCRNVVLVKDPLPNLRARRFQVLEKKWSRPLVFAYADDIASRTLAQQVGRGLRSPSDWARLWLVDSNVMPRLERVTEGRADVVMEPAPPVRRSLADVVASLPPPLGPLAGAGGGGAG